MQALEEIQAWIATGGVAAPVTVEPLGIIPLTNSVPTVPSNGEFEVGGSDAELPMPKQLLSKVWQADNIEHMLDKGVWETMPAKCQGWEIFMDVSFQFFPLHS